MAQRNSLRHVCFMAGLLEQVIVAGVDRTGRPESPMPATVHPQQILLWVVFIIYEARWCSLH
jgi:hypothetical protein